MIPELLQVPQKVVSGFPGPIVSHTESSKLGSCFSESDENAQVPLGTQGDMLPIYTI